MCYNTSCLHYELSYLGALTFVQGALNEITDLPVNILVFLAFEVMLILFLYVYFIVCLTLHNIHFKNSYYSLCEAIEYLITVKSAFSLLQDREILLPGHGIL